jgi:hypothetical protein
MNKTEFSELLKNLNACEEAKVWAEGKSLEAAWKTCKRADWMLWILVKMLKTKGFPNKRLVFNSVADCAETALHLFEKKYPDDKISREAIQAVRNYADDKITLKELKKYRAAADAAYAAAAAAAYAAAAADAAAADAAAADAAADAAAADAAAAYAAAAAAADAADAAADAATAAAYAAYAAADAYAAKKSSLKNMANLIRKRIPKIN